MFRPMLSTTPGPDEDWRSVPAAIPGYGGVTCLSAGTAPAGDAHATGSVGLLFTLHRQGASRTELPWTTGWMLP